MPLCERCHGLVHDRAMISHVRLTKQALQSKKARNERVGAVPYGKMLLTPDSVWLLDNPAEQAVMVKARELHTHGLSLRAIGKTLAYLGHRARNGRVFSAEQIKRML